MKRTWTIIGVHDVPTSFKWYQSLFGQPPTSPGHPEFGMLVAEILARVVDRVVST